MSQLSEAHASRQLLWQSVLDGTENAFCRTSLRRSNTDDCDGHHELPLACNRVKIQDLITTRVERCVREVEVTDPGPPARGFQSLAKCILCTAGCIA